MFGTALRQFDQLASVLQAAAQGTAQVEFVSFSGSHPAGAALAQVPAQGGHHAAGLGHFLAAELGEVLLTKNLPGAVRAGEVDLRY